MQEVVCEVASCLLEEDSVSSTSMLTNVQLSNTGFKRNAKMLLVPSNSVLKEMFYENAFSRGIVLGLPFKEAWKYLRGLDSQFVEAKTKNRVVEDK